MSKDGLAMAPQGTTLAPKGMYREEEQDETVARGCVRVTEVIAYDFVRMETVMDELTGKPTEMKRKIEKGREPYFYQNSEDFVAFRDNNPDARLESFDIQMRKATAIKRLNKKSNVIQFTKRENG